MVIKSEEDFRQFFESAIEKDKKGIPYEDFSPEEQEAVKFYNNEIKRQQRGMMSESANSNSSKEVFAKKSQEVVKKGGKRVIHITDTHSKKDLEKLIRDIVEEDAKIHGRKDTKTIPKDLVFVHTGDLINELLGGGSLEEFIGENIVAKAGFTKEEEKEFLSVHKTILEKYSGVSEEQLRSGQLDKKIWYKFNGIYREGHVPEFLSNEEIKEFNRDISKLHKFLRKGITNHASKEYKEFAKMLSSLGLTPENFLVIGGNHDVSPEMEKVLSKYMIKAGEVKKVGGFKIGNVLSGATASPGGSKFQDLFGYADISEAFRPQNTKAFQELKGRLHKLGFDYIGDPHLEELIATSRGRASQGLGGGALFNYYSSVIQPEVDRTIKAKIGQIATKIPKDVDFIVGHGDPTHSKYAGVEEKHLEGLLSSKGIPYLHGHVHEPSVGRAGKNSSKHGKNDSAIYLNPGSGRDFGAYGSYLFDKGGKLEGVYMYDNSSRGRFILPEQIDFKKEGGSS